MLASYLVNQDNKAKGIKGLAAMPSGVVGTVIDVAIWGFAIAGVYWFVTEKKYKKLTGK
jgi:hypothetical protein